MIYAKIYTCVSNNNIAYCFHVNSPPCPRQAASRNYDQALLLVNGVGAAARSAHAWIRQPTCGCGKS